MTHIFVIGSEWVNWRASETLTGLNNGNRRYICIYFYIVREPHFSSTGTIT